VLGEQSYTLLQGRKTEDMIFPGRASPPAGMASLEIVFDSTNNRWTRMWPRRSALIAMGWLPVKMASTCGS
jgi:chromosome segregation ATPase